MSGISTHMLDVAAGSPATGVEVTLERRSGGGWSKVGEGTTDADGRVASLLSDRLSQGTYRITFATAEYLSSRGEKAFFPEVTVTFEVDDAETHHHVPLLLSPFGYTTYRGS